MVKKSKSKVLFGLLKTWVVKNLFGTFNHHTTDTQMQNKENANHLLTHLFYTC